MSKNDLNTARRIPLAEINKPAHRDLVLRFAIEHASGAVQRALLTLIGAAR